MMPMLAQDAIVARQGALDALATVSAPKDYVAQVHRDHAAMTYAVAMRATRDPELAEDVTQEAFIRLLTEARAGRYPDSPGAWLYRAVTNLVISRARRAQVARRLAPRLADLGSPDQPDAVAVRHESQDELRRALAGLSSDERTALLLAAGGASGLEIAAHLGRSHGATRALLCRARTRLRSRAALGRPAEDVASVAAGVAPLPAPMPAPARAPHGPKAPMAVWPVRLPVQPRTAQVWAVTCSR